MYLIPPTKFIVETPTFCSENDIANVGQKKIIVTITERTLIIFSAVITGFLVISFIVSFLRYVVLDFRHWICFIKTSLKSFNILQHIVSIRQCLTIIAAVIGGSKHYSELHFHSDANSKISRFNSCFLSFKRSSLLYL